MQEALRMLAKQYPSSTRIVATYYGAGDSFESFTSITDDLGNSVGVNEDVLWYALDKSDVNFNDDGCEGEIEIFLRPTLHISVAVRHYVTSTEDGDGYEEDFGYLGASLDDALLL